MFSRDDRSFAYNTTGQLISVSLPSVPDPLNGGQLTAPLYQYRYNDQGQMVELVDPLGRETRFVFSEQGQQTSRTLPLGFGADGMAGTSDDPAVGSSSSPPFTETTEYDIKGRAVVQISFEGVVTRLYYDDNEHGNGRLIEKQFFDNATQFNGGMGVPSETQLYSYDAFGRMISTQWSSTSGGANTRSDVWTNSYDSQGRLTKTTSPTGEIHFEYDIFGRQVRKMTRSTVFQPTSAADFENDFRYSYDVQGRLIKVETVERLNTIVDVIPTQAGNQPETESYFYTLQGSLDYELNPDGSVTDYTYDVLNRLTDIDEYRKDPNVGPGAPDPDFTDNPKLSEHSYTLRADGKRSSADEKIFKDDGTLFSHTQYDWTYDNAGRLTDEVFEDVGDLLTNVDDYQAQYTYDLTGNRVEKSVMTDSNDDGLFSAATDEDTVTTYSHDANDRMLSESTSVDGAATESTAYGFTGTQQTSKTVTDLVPTVPTVKSAVSYTYDLQGRMSRAVTTSGNRTSDVTYRYGTDGIRISAREDVTENGTTSTRITSYLIDAHNPTGYQQVLQETVTDGTGALIQDIVYAIGHDHISQTTRRAGDVSPPSDSTVVFHFDGHGNTRVLTDLAGTIVSIAGLLQVYHYDAYGNALNFSMTAAATQYLYSGEQFDPRIGQQYLRARYYDSATGTFNRLDPFFGNQTDPQSFHKYLYTHGDPVNGIDPMGEFLIGILGGLAVGMHLRNADAKRSVAKYMFAGAAIDAILVQATRNAFWALGLSASPVRNLTPEEVTVLTWLHENAGHPYSGNSVRSEMSGVKLYRASDIGIGDWTSVWGIFSSTAMARGFGAVTQRGQIFFNTAYDPTKKWVPDPGIAQNIALLAHETTHTLQAADSLGGMFGFGPHYLIETLPSPVGYGYHGSIPEIEGYAMEFAVRDLLVAYPNLVAQIVAGTPPASAATDLAAFYRTYEATQRTTYGR